MNEKPFNEHLEENMRDDPFGTAMYLIKEALERALDDGINGLMNEHELEILEDVARIVTQRGGMEVNPRPA